MTYLPITLSGNLIEDPVSKVFDTGTFLTRLRLASSRRVRTDSVDPSGNNMWADTDNLYIDVECWGQLALNVNASLRKGVPVIVSGRLVSEKWTDKENVTRYKHIIKANHIALELSRHQVAYRSTASQAHTPNGVDEVKLLTAEEFGKKHGVTVTQVTQNAKAPEESQESQNAQGDQQEKPAPSSNNQSGAGDGVLNRPSGANAPRQQPAMAG